MTPRCSCCSGEHLLLCPISASAAHVSHLPTPATDSGCWQSRGPRLCPSKPPLPTLKWIASLPLRPPLQLRPQDTYPTVQAGDGSDLLIKGYERDRPRFCVWADATLAPEDSRQARRQDHLEDEQGDQHKQQLPLPAELHGLRESVDLGSLWGRPGRGMDPPAVAAGGGSPSRVPQLPLAACGVGGGPAVPRPSCISGSSNPALQALFSATPRGPGCLDSDRSVYHTARATPRSARLRQLLAAPGLQEGIYSGLDPDLASWEAHDASARSRTVEQLHESLSWSQPQARRPPASLWLSCGTFCLQLAW